MEVLSKRAHWGEEKRARAQTHTPYESPLIKNYFIKGSLKKQMMNGLCLYEFGHGQSFSTGACTRQLKEV